MFRSPHSSSRRAVRLLRVAVAVVALQAAGPVRSAEPSASNGFDLTGARIPVDQILRGGPPRDGIPALDFPPFVAAADASWSDDTRVVGVSVHSIARAYPLAILVWHELVNDRVGGRPLLVSYCPLCGTALVFDRRVDGVERRFGVSGLLYRSDLLMFDRESESLWSQISARALTGPARDRRLALVRSRVLPWGDWKRAHPRSSVLSRATGHARDYGRSPYAGYESSKRLLFPVSRDPRYHPKMRTLGLRWPDGRARGYPLVEVQRAGGRVAESPFGDAVAIRLAPDSLAFEVDAPERVEVIEGFWFAWTAFHPGATVFVAE